jgi:hypothetical protein
MTRQDAARLIARIAEIRLFAHAYSWHLNLQFGDATPADFLRFADWSAPTEVVHQLGWYDPIFGRTRRQLQRERSRKTLF